MRTLTAQSHKSNWLYDGSDGVSIISDILNPCIEFILSSEGPVTSEEYVGIRASLRFEQRLNVSINPRKLSIFSQVFLNRSEALVGIASRERAPFGNGNA